MIYGHYYKTLRKSRLIEETCPNCGAKEIQLEIITKVDHIMFIPCWSEQKEMTVTCPVCNKHYHISDFPGLYYIGKELLLKSYRKWYHYTGTILFLIFTISTGILIYTGSEEQQQKKHAAVENLWTGDVIFYKLKNGKKTSMIVDEVRGDSVFVRENKLSTNKDIRWIDEEENYSGKQSLYLKSQLHRMSEDGTIIRIY